MKLEPIKWKIKDWLYIHFGIRFRGQISRAELEEAFNNAIGDIGGEKALGKLPQESSRPRKEH